MNGKITIAIISLALAVLMGLGGWGLMSISDHSKLLASLADRTPTTTALLSSERERAEIAASINSIRDSYNIQSSVLREINARLDRIEAGLRTQRGGPR